MNTHISCDTYHTCRLIDGDVERVRKCEEHKTVVHLRMLKQNK